MLVGNAACWFSANDIMQACWSKKPKAIILHYGQYHAFPYCDLSRNTADNNRNLYLKDILNEPGQLFSSTCSSLLQKCSVIAASSSGEQKLHRNRHDIFSFPHLLECKVQVLWFWLFWILRKKIKSAFSPYKVCHKKL